MRQHFPKPERLMPVAWFMGGKIDFHTEIAESRRDEIEPSAILEALNDIAGGIYCFPDTEYVADWVAWFKYLLPESIQRLEDNKTMVALMNVYPESIIEEYSGFRDDVVSTLGICLLPEHLSRDDKESDDPPNAVLNDFWNMSWDYWTDAEIWLVSSVLFCLEPVMHFRGMLEIDEKDGNTKKVSN
jgi:hypothetical protein